MNRNLFNHTQLAHKNTTQKHYTKTLREDNSQHFLPTQHRVNTDISVTVHAENANKCEGVGPSVW